MRRIQLSVAPYWYNIHCSNQCVYGNVFTRGVILNRPVVFKQTTDFAKRCFQNTIYGCIYTWNLRRHYNYVIKGAMASQITSLTIVYSTVHSGADQIKHQSSASLAFVRGIHRGPVNSPHKWPVTRKMCPFDDVIMERRSFYRNCHLNDIPYRIEI